MGRLTESSIVSIKNKSHAVTAAITVPDGGAQGGETARDADGVLAPDELLRVAMARQ
jgi:hypothetical protein